MLPPSESETSAISVAELAILIENRGVANKGSADWILVDCREADEHAICHIHGARLIPLSEFSMKAESQLPADKGVTIVVYCHHGMRSQQAADYLRKKGRPKTFSVTGGIDAWSKEYDSNVPRY